MKDFESLLGNDLPNGVVIDGVLCWLSAAYDKLDRDTKSRIMIESFNEEDIEQTKVLMVELVHRKQEYKKIVIRKGTSSWIGIDQ